MGICRGRRKEHQLHPLDTFYRIVDRSSPGEIDEGDISILFQLVYQHSFHGRFGIPREEDLADVAARTFGGLDPPLGERCGRWIDGPLTDPSYRNRLLENLSGFCALYPLGFPIAVAPDALPMRRELPEKFIYLFALAASPATSVDTLQYLHWDLLQISGEVGLQGVILGAHVAWIDRDGRVRRALMVDGRGLPVDTIFEEPVRPDIVHIGHLSSDAERTAHRELSKLFRRSRIRMVNPYSPGVEICDSKFRTSSVLRSAGVKVPDCLLISRFSERSGEALLRRIAPFLKAHEGRDIFVQPDRGTEGVGCRVFEAGGNDAIDGIIGYVLSRDDDVIVRAGAGNVEYRDEGGSFSPVFRMNVSFDGRGWHAESGFALIGHGVVSGSSNSGKIDINRAFGSLYSGGRPLDLKDVEMGGIRETICRAAEAVFSGSEPLLILGVDFVLEATDGGIEPLILDLNPRCVIPGSYRIGPGRPELGLGESFWRGVLKRAN